jgi:hypothetical protein
MRLFDQLPAEAQERQAARLGKGRFEAGLKLVDLANWTAQFTEGPVRQNAIIGILTAAFEKDASQVEPLLASVKTSADHDAALRGLAAAMSWNEPNEAATRALQINDLSIRQEALEAVMFSWLKRDPTKGQEWLTAQGSTIPETWKQGWLETAKSGAEH